MSNTRTEAYLEHYEDMTNQDLFNWYGNGNTHYDIHELMYFYLMVYRVMFSVRETETDSSAKAWLDEALSDLFSHGYMSVGEEITNNEMVVVGALAQYRKDKLYVSDKTYYTLFKNIISGTTESSALNQMVSLVGTVYDKKDDNIRPELVNFYHMAANIDLVEHADKLKMLDEMLKHSINICEFSPVNLVICKLLDIKDGIDSPTSESMAKTVGKFILTVVTGVVLVVFIHAIFKALFGKNAG